MSPRWSHQYYRYEHHFNFRLPSEDAVTAAVERISELCEELRNPVQDAIPEPPADGGEPAWGAVSGSSSAVERVQSALAATEAQLGTASLGEETFDQRLHRMMLFLNHLGQMGG